MFHNSLRKIRLIETAVLAGSDKYVDVLEGLSITTIDLEDSSSPPIIPEGKKLKILASDVNHALDEAYIDIQTAMSRIRSDLAEWTSVYDDKETIELNKPVEARLKNHLNIAYDQVMESVDFKATVLRSVQRTCNHYVKTVASMGDESGALQSIKKVELVTHPLFDPLRSNRFFATAEEDAMLGTIRNLWASKLFHSTDLTLLADRQLSSKHFVRHHQHSHWQYHTKLGATCVLLLWAASECVNNELSERDIWNDQTFLIFLCLGDLLLLLLMWGVSIQVWRRAGIDFVKLLELEHTELAGSVHPERSVYHTGANICMLFLLAFILFNKAVRGGYFGQENDLTFAHAIPALLVVFCGVRMFFPCQTRKSWMHMLWRVLAAPFFLVNFRDGYIGDLLTSLVRVFIPLCFSVIYVSETAYAWLSNDLSITTERSGDWLTGAFYYKFLLLPVLTLFPLWLRLLQCLRRSVDTGKRWPHIGNVLKYTSAIVVISFGTFQPAIRNNSFWIASFVFATLFQFVWDLTQDWGMILISPPQHDIPSASSSGLAVVDCLVHTRVTFRKTRLLGPLSNYIAVILFNLTLRFAWTLTLLPAPTDLGETRTLYVFAMRHLGPILASLEIVRRMVWGFFRLEWEQIEQMGKAKTDRALETSLAGDLDELDKMDITSSVEMQPLSSYLASSSLSQDELWTETDWIAWLPPYVARAVDSSLYLRGCATYQSKLRAVEAVIFVVAVLYIVALAAAPAYA